MAATESTAQPTRSTTPTPQPKPTSTSKPTATPGAVKAVKALKACQSRVRAADDVLAAGKTGTLHWAAHVQAQTDANKSKITVTEMKARFKESRLAGPADQQRYADALSTYKDLSGSCGKVKGAEDKVAGKLADCNERAKAQKPLLAATANGMADWKSHLAAMQRSSEGHVANAQGVWLRAWRAAPPHINAYKQAAADFHAPNC